MKYLNPFCQGCMEKINLNKYEWKKKPRAYPNGSKWKTCEHKKKYPSYQPSNTVCHKINTIIIIIKMWIWHSQNQSFKIYKNEILFLLLEILIIQFKSYILLLCDNVHIEERRRTEQKKIEDKEKSWNWKNFNSCSVFISNEYCKELS
jgi:hypothetical protein